MGSNLVSDGIETVTHHVPVPVLLKDQDHPELSADLQANNHDLLGVKNVECKTVNGADLLKLIADGLDGLAKKCSELYANDRHAHPELESLISAVDLKAESLKTTKVYSETDHTHALSELPGTLPLSSLEQGRKLESILSRSLSDSSHSHPELTQELYDLKQTLGDLRAASAQLATAREAEKIWEAINGLTTWLSEQLRVLRKSMPVLPAPEPIELLASRYCLIPRKCDSKFVKEISAVDFDGAQVQATVTRAGKPVTTGDIVHTDELLSLSPPKSIVRFLFS